MDKKICCVSAPAKGNTLLNFCGITNREIKYVSEANKMKIGRFTPSSGLSIVPDKYLETIDPDILIVLAWNFFDTIRNVAQKSAPRAKIVHPFKLDCLTDD